MPAVGRFVPLTGAVAMVATVRWRPPTPPHWRANGGRWAPHHATCIASFAASTPPPGRFWSRARPMTTKTILVECLTRVEGEGALDLQIRNGRVTAAQLKIF